MCDFADQVDSPFQLQEHLKALYNNFTKPAHSSTVIPVTREVAVQLAEPPEGVERALWLYELCRFLTMKVNNLIVAFFAENPPCSAQTCSEMRASEWQYLCAVHDPPKSCCAIDYCCHTLDWATNILTSPKYFPSRLVLGSEAGGGPQASMKHLTNIFRRLYRIFAHAWFEHREAFWQVEGNEGLYILFKTVCDMYSLIPEDSYTVPVQAEGIEVDERPAPSQQTLGPQFTLLRKENEGTASHLNSRHVDMPSLIADTNTRRHKSSPSANPRITTIAEDNEEHHKSPEATRDSVLGGPQFQGPVESRDEQPGEKAAEDNTDAASAVTVEMKEPEPELGQSAGSEPERPVHAGEEQGESHVGTSKETTQLEEPAAVENSSTENPKETGESEGKTETKTETPEAKEINADDRNAQRESSTEADTQTESESKLEGQETEQHESGQEAPTRPESSTEDPQSNNPAQQSEPGQEGADSKAEPVQEENPKTEVSSEPKAETAQPEPKLEDSSNKAKTESESESESKEQAEANSS